MFFYSKKNTDEAPSKRKQSKQDPNIDKVIGIIENLEKVKS